MSARRDELDQLVASVRTSLGEAHAAREAALPACRQAIRSAGLAIRALHRFDPEGAATRLAESGAAIRLAQDALRGHPSVEHAGFLHDAEKEFAEANVAASLIGGQPLPGPDDLGVAGAAWLRGLAEAASELRRHLLDRLRAGEVDRAEELLAVMDDAYDVLVTVDLPDALTGGLRRTVDALRAVLERSRGDVTTTVVQARLQHAIEAQAPT